MSVKRLLASVLGLALLQAGCAGGGGDLASRTGGGAVPDGRPLKVITVAVTGTVHAMSIAGDVTTSGGWQSVNELHANGLVTSDFVTRRPVPRLAERVPSFDDGSIALLPDGRMRVDYRLRRGITWHDGAPFTSRDPLFSFGLQTDGGLPVIDRKLGRNLLDSAAATDDYTFTITFTGPYYRADSLGIACSGSTRRISWVPPTSATSPAEMPASC